MLDPQLTASLAPPLVGALAGYAGGRLALLLLFKPRRPWRLLGLRLPLTPGAFAFGREEFAVGVGNAVGNHLLHQAEIERATSAPAFAEPLRQALDQRLGELLDRDLGPAASLVPNRFRGFYEMGGKVARLRFQQLLHSHLDSSAFGATLQQELARQQVTVLSGEECLALVRSPQFKRLLDTLLGELLAAKVLARPIGPLAKVLPAEVQEGVGDLLLLEVNALLLREVPRLLATMDLRSAVARRLMELDPRHYETLLRQALGRRANLLALLAALAGLALGAVASFGAPLLPMP